MAKSVGSLDVPAFFPDSDAVETEQAVISAERRYSSARKTQAVAVFATGD